MSTASTLDGLNAASAADFTSVLGGIFEHAPWVAAEAAAARPFATVTALHAAMMAAVRAAPPERRLAFLCGHPELAGAAALAGTMQADSTAEQAGLGLERQAIATLAELNGEYRARFGFPFILCVRRHTAASVLAAFRRRLQADPAEERATALREIGFITRLRLVDRVTGPGLPETAGSLTTHVLDTSLGRPAAGVAVTLLEVGGVAPVVLADGVTDHQGRTSRPLLQDGPLRIGWYELRFDVGAYFGDRLAEQPAFLNVVCVRFAISEPETHMHIPLLVSPGGYTTYRGS